MDLATAWPGSCVGSCCEVLRGSRHPPASSGCLEQSLRGLWVWLPGQSQCIFLLPARSFQRWLWSWAQWPNLPARSPKEERTASLATHRLLRAVPTGASDPPGEPPALELPQLDSAPRCWGGRPSHVQVPWAPAFQRRGSSLSALNCWEMPTRFWTLWPPGSTRRWVGVWGWFGFYPSFKFSLFFCNLAIETYERVFLFFFKNTFLNEFFL